jgi:hypothetical protein
LKELSTAIQFLLGGGFGFSGKPGRLIWQNDAQSICNAQRPKNANRWLADVTPRTGFLFPVNGTRPCRDHPGAGLMTLRRAG